MLSTIHPWFPANGMYVLFSIGKRREYGIPLFYEIPHLAVVSRKKENFFSSIILKKEYFPIGMAYAEKNSPFEQNALYFGRVKSELFSWKRACLFFQGFHLSLKRQIFFRFAHFLFEYTAKMFELLMARNGFNLKARYFFSIQHVTVS